jgi:hypothetical protein
MRYVVFALFLSIFAGCAAPRTDILTKTDSYPPTLDVEILLDPPKRAHKTFALLEDRAGGTPEEINARFIDAGREIGADAILITEVKNETSTEWVVAGSQYYGRRFAGVRYEPVQYRYRSVRAKALKYSSAP